MKKFSVLMLALLAIMPMLIGSAQASPYLVCDPQAGVEYYKITGDAYWTATVPAQADGSIKSDLAGITSGDHNLQIAACKSDATWGEVCSAATPFAFARPAIPGAPTNLKLAP